MTDERVDISLIICTKDRCNQLHRCLQTIRSLVFDRPWELILVDNGSVDETAAVISEFASTTSVPVQYVYELKPGLGNGHNSGVKRARGEILAFTDDDCYPAPDYLENLWRAFGNELVGYLTGRILLHDPDDYPITINEATTPTTFHPGSYLVAGSFQGANMAFRRQVLRDINGFDPLFGPGAPFNTEDVDAAARASDRGWLGQYCPEVLIRHHHGRKFSDIPALRKSYAIGRGGYEMKLLLKGHQGRRFARTIIVSMWHRWRGHRKEIVWEIVGTIKYGFIFFRLCLPLTYGPARQRKTLSNS